MEFKFVIYWQPIPGATRCKAYVCRCTFPGIAGSNPAGSIVLCPLWVLCFVMVRSLRRPDPSSRGFLPNGCVCVCVIECDRVQRYPLAVQWVGRRGPTKKKDLFVFIASRYLIIFWTWKKYLRTEARILNITDFPFIEDFRRVKSKYRQCLIRFRDNYELKTRLDN
jgi:hypothetical protein